MFKQIRIGLLATMIVVALASCNNGNSDVRDEARQAVENQVQPANPSSLADQSFADQAATQVPTGPTTEMTFEETEFDFGTINEGEQVTHTYKFKNTGKEPLVISNAQGSCGCTVPQWSKEPVAPGASGSVTVEFNSKNKNGKRNQKVTLTANTDPPQTFLYLTGEVVGGESAQPQIQVNN